MKYNEINNNVSKINTKGDGSKFWADDGNYKTITFGNATSLNNIPIDDSTRADGRFFRYNNTTRKVEYVDLTVSGIVGSTGNIIVPSGLPISISSGSEITVTHPTATYDKMLINVQEKFDGSTITDNRVNFSDTSLYSFKTDGNIIFDNNNAKLDIYTKFLLHADSAISDICGHTITNSNVTLDTSNKKIGSASAKFNGTSSILTIPSSSDLEFLDKDFTISLSFYTTSLANHIIVYDKRIIPSQTGFTAYVDMSGNLKLNASSQTGSLDLAHDFIMLSGITTNTWQYIEIVRIGNTIKASLNGMFSSNILSITSAIGTSSSDIHIGGSSDNNFLLNGNIDEYKITIGKALHTNNFTPPIINQIGVPYLVSNTPTYFKTSPVTSFSLTTLLSFTSLTIPMTIPTNTSVKCLFSVDNRTNWLYKDGTGIYKFTGDLATSWTSSNSNIELQTYFTNLTLSQFKTDLSSLGINPVSLDFIFQLNTSDLTVTPVISPIILVYVTQPHIEFASFGGYDEQYVKFGIKTINDTTLSVKNLTNKDRTVNINVIIGS